MATKSQATDGSGQEVFFLNSPDIQVDQVVQPFILKCGPDLPLFEAARRMQQARCSSIIVMEGDRAVGIWTERDALRIDFSSDAFSLPIGEVMTSPVKTIPRTTQLREVAAKFRTERLRHYLVVDDAGRPYGVISQTDVVANHGIEYYLHLRKVKGVLTRPLVLLEPSISLKAAAGRMHTHSTDAAVIRYDDGEYGILTERDLVRLISDRHGEDMAGSVASRPLRTVEDDSTLYRVRNLLLEHRIRHVGVTRQGELVGLISFADIVAGLETIHVEELQNALRERDAALSASRRSLILAEKVIECSLEGVMITDAEGRIQSVNPAFTQLTGYEAEEVIGKTPAILSSGRHDAEFYRRFWRQLGENGYWHGEIWNRRKSGEVYPELLTVTAIRDDAGRLIHYASIFSDITKLKENEERIKRLAYFDSLTDLPNRRLLNDRISVAIAHAHRNRKSIAVLFVDLDRFKRVNDSLGHGIGDGLLREVARRLVASVREGDTVARMGGDEFVVLLSDLDSADRATIVARRVIESLQLPVVVEGEELVVTSSVGIAVYPRDGETADELIRNADIAMYRAKRLGRNGYQSYSPALSANSREYLTMEVSLRKAVEREEFVVHYQPIVDRAGSTVGAEALLRWMHPELGLLAPADFIPLAEEMGLILPIGELVLRQVCRESREWWEAGYQELNIAVNISARQFGSENFLAAIKAILREESMASHMLTLEMTESMLVDDAVATVRMLQEIRSLGIAIAIDDFGIGYSSLNYLKRFPINKLKIDRSFIREITENKEDAAIVSAIITLAHSLRMQVVAEGIERKRQFELLKAFGCDNFQGYFFGLPMAPDQFRAAHLRQRLPFVREAVKERM